jgi:hypothetical protein
MLSKILGSVILTFSAFGFYFELRKFQKKRIRQLNSFIDFIGFVQNRLECYMLPIDQILSECEPNLIIDMCANDNLSKFKTLDEVALSINFLCDYEVKELMICFLGTFGKSYLNEQIASCKYFTSELIKKRDAMIEADLNNRKLQLAVCLCASLSIIIMLI